MLELRDFIDYKVTPGPITVEDIKVLYGANYFSGGPVVLFRINLGEFDEVYTNKIPGFFEKLKTSVPSLYKHHCSVGRVGGFLERVQEGTLLGHVMEHTAIELQNLAGMDVGFGKTRGAKKKGIYNVVFRYFDEIAGTYAGKAALNLINAILEGVEMDVAEVINNLIVIREKRLLGPSTQAIVHEAERRKIPVLRLDKYNQVQLGTGKFKKLIRATITEDTSLLAVETSDDKFLTNSILQDAGIPVPQQIITEKLEDALAFHAQLQRPVVVKPAQGYQGKRVSIDLNTPEVIEKAFQWAKESHKEVVLQEDISGGSYRLLVIDFKMVAAVRLIPANITGNGTDSISELINKVNLEPGREFGDKGKLTKIDIDEDTLKIIELRGFSLDSVLPPGETIFLKNTGNMKLGASATDVTNQVHPFNVFLASRVAKILNLNVAGIDVISEDITQPMNLNNGKVIEVNAAPDFRMHFNPTFGTSRYIQRDYLSMLFPTGTQCSVPIYSITGSKGKSLCASIIKTCLSRKGMRIGSVGKNGLYINDFCIVSGDATESKNVAIVLKDPTVDCAILETPVESILTSGLGYEYAHFGLILNLIDQKKEYYTYDHIRDIEDIAYAKMVVSEQVFDSGYVVLNADLKEITEMKSRIYSRIAMFSRNRNNLVFSKHLLNRGVGILLENGAISIFDNNLEISILEMEKIPVISQIIEDYVIDAVLAAIVTLYLSDVSIDFIRTVLLEFENPVNS
jgi:cyanophycin synthetase